MGPGQHGELFQQGSILAKTDGTVNVLVVKSRAWLEKEAPKSIWELRCNATFLLKSLLHFSL